MRGVLLSTRRLLSTLSFSTSSSSAAAAATPAGSFAYAKGNLPPAQTRHCDLVIDRAAGVRVYPKGDTQGYLDFTCGIGVTSTGHCHPRVVEAIQKQASTVILTQLGCYFGERSLELTEEIRKLVPPRLDTIFFTNSGTEAIENAVKIARGGTGRPYVIAMEGSFHGRSYLTMAMTGSKLLYRQKFGPMPGNIEHAPFPYAYRYGWNEEQAVKHCLRELEYILVSRCPPEETAALVIESVLGEGGYVPVPVAFMRGVREICTKHGIQLIIDEVQAGIGRTGKWFGYQHADIEPDIIVMAKGIASGMPLAAIASPRHLHKDLVGGSLGGTYGGSNAVTNAAAIATLQTIRDEKLVENSAKMGDYLMSNLRKLQAKYPVIGDVRGRGLMIGVEFTTKDGKPDGATVAALKKYLTENRLLLLTCGVYANVFRWIPPLIITKEHADEALGIFERGLQYVTKA